MKCETITWNTGIPPLRDGDRTYERTVDVLLRVTNGKRFFYYIAYMVKFDLEEDFTWRIQGPDCYEIRDEIVEWAILKDK
jgi:hypothetical protein